MTVDAVLTQALDWSLRAGVFLVPALLYALLSRRSSAAVRHAVCFAAVAIAIAVPFATSVLPRFDVAVLPAVTGPAGSVSMDSDSPDSFAGGGVFLLGLWLGGAIVVAARVAGGVARAEMLCRVAREVSDARVLSMAIRVRREIGLIRPIRVLSQRRLGVPFTWGIRRSVVLLPNGAHRWSRGRLRAVLLHELTHVKRRDCLTQLVADLACAVYWFHPLVWFAAARMRVERERACDDTVVAVGGRPSGYAVLLLRMVKGIQGTPGLLPEPVATFGAGGGLTGRLRALLGPARDRRALSPAAALAFALGALTLALPVTVLELTRRAPDPVGVSSHRGLTPFIAEVHNPAPVIADVAPAHSCPVWTRDDLDSVLAEAAGLPATGVTERPLRDVSVQGEKARPKTGRRRGIVIVATFGFTLGIPFLMLPE